MLHIVLTAPFVDMRLADALVFLVFIPLFQLVHSLPFLRFSNFAARRYA